MGGPAVGAGGPAAKHRLERLHVPDAVGPTRPVRGPFRAGPYHLGDHCGSDQLRAGLPGHSTISRAPSADQAPCHPSSIMLDRKSTRLNSSHLVISYAVFCLKKKNTKKLH